MIKKVVDYIIIGGGISGFYLALKLKKSDPNLNVILLEKEEQFGGRIKYKSFECRPNSHYAVGAGSIRKSDTLVLNLCKMLNIEFSENISETIHKIPNYPNEKEASVIFKEWCLLYEKNKREIQENGYSMENFLTRFYGIDKVQEWKKMSGYNDFWNSDVSDTLNFYPSSEIFWNKDSLYSVKGGYRRIFQVLEENVKSNQVECISSFKVTKVKQLESKKQGTLYKVQGHYRPTKEDVSFQSSHEKFYCRKVIFATTKCALKNIQMKPKIHFLDEIENQNFVVILTLHDTIIPSSIPDTVIWGDEGKKHIVFNRKKGVLLGVYCDNEYCSFWYHLLKNGTKKTLIHHLQELYNKRYSKDDLSPIKDVICQYWHTGTHYYLPRTKDLGLSRIEYIKNNYINPNENMYFCGEMISLEQGWVQGALESVERLFSILNK